MKTERFALGDRGEFEQGAPAGPGEEQKPDWHVDKIKDNKVFTGVLKKINNRLHKPGREKQNGKP